MKVEKKLYETNYQITTPNYKKNKQLKIMVASDIHYQRHVDRKLFNILVKYATYTKPDYIIMPGDQIETIDFIDDNNCREFFESIIVGLSKIAPVIMIPGNHEIKNFSKDNFKKRLDNNNNDINTKAINYFESLNKYKNVYFLNNKQITLNGITFLGFSPRLSSYQKINDKQVEDEFIEDYINSGLKMNKDTYNILITHSPLQLVSENVFNSISEIKSSTDLVITGHLHDGYLPKFLDKKYGNTNKGLFITPRVKSNPGIICRGIHEFGEGYLFVSQGYRKWTADIFLFNLFERISANDIENIIITKGDDKKIEVSSNKPFVKQ